MDYSVCRDFKLGKCHKGKKCRYKHEVENPNRVEVYKSFFDLSTKPEGRENFAKNKELFGEGDYLGCLAKANSERVKELLKFIRRFQSQVELPTQGDLLSNLEQDVLIKLKWSPTIHRQSLCLTEHILERYFMLDIDIPQGYPQEPAQFKVTNPSLTQKLKEDMSNQMNRTHKNVGPPYSITQTFKLIDNNFDKFCQILMKTEKPPEKEAQIVIRVPKPRPRPQNLEQTQQQDLTQNFAELSITEQPQEEKRQVS